MKKILGNEGKFNVRSFNVNTTWGHSSGCDEDFFFEWVCFVFLFSCTSDWTPNASIKIFINYKLIGEVIKDFSKCQKMRDRLLTQQRFGGSVIATTHSSLLGFLWCTDTPCLIWTAAKLSTGLLTGGRDSALWLQSVNKAEKAHFIFLHEYILHHHVREWNCFGKIMIVIKNTRNYILNYYY